MRGKGCTACLQCPLAACPALAGRHVLPFCLGLIVGFVFSVGLGAAEKIFILFENSSCIM